MRTDFGNVEEKITGKSYDLKLFGRLFIFIKPYRMIFYLSVFLMILISVLDISIPYMTKIAVDRYIVPVNATVETDEAAKIRLNTGNPEVMKIAELHGTLFVKDGEFVEIEPEAFNQLTHDEKSRYELGIYPV